VDRCGYLREEKRADTFLRTFGLTISRGIRLYRKRASDFELLAEREASPDVRRRNRIIARHYRELAEREEQLKLEWLNALSS
jgi:hypothetical protein